VDLNGTVALVFSVSGIADLFFNSCNVFVLDAVHDRAILKMRVSE